MDFSDLRAFLAVVECGSFQRAATARQVSRSTVSRQVERLESEVGTPLLFRAAGGATVTAAGRELVAGAGRLLGEASTLVERARAASGDTRGRLRFVVPTGMPVGLRARALLMLRATHSELDIELTEAEDPLKRIESEFDLLLHFGDAPEREGWFSHVIIRVPTRLQATPKYLESHGLPKSLDDLSTHSLVQWRWPQQEPGVLPLRNGGTAPISPWFRTANLPLLQEVASGGGGIVFGPVIPPFQGVEPSKLVQVLDDVVGGTVTIRALSRHPSRVDPKLRALLENVQRLLAARAPQNR